MEYITIDDFAKVEIKVGLILGAEIIEESEKLLKLSVDFGEENPRQVLSGIRTYMALDELVGRKYLFVTNLKPRTMMGMESQAMILGSGPTCCAATIQKVVYCFLCNPCFGSRITHWICNRVFFISIYWGTTCCMVWGRRRFYFI